MLERDAYPPGVPCWVDTAQPDPDAAAEFYGGLFGWTFEDQTPGGAPGKHFVAHLRGRDVAGVRTQPDRESEGPVVWHTYVSVESADAAADTAKAAGGSVLLEPSDVGSLGRLAVLSDPSGAAFRVWEAGDHAGAALVNEPGTWNFSDLHTRDPEGATSFYAAIFGWEATTFGVGDNSFTFWSLPDYGDFLEGRDPELRTRQASEGAPAGFENAVAGLAVMTSERYADDVPAHWSVTFTVDDTDGAADRATSLGGTLLMPPFDAGPTRVAVVGDPQGAVFSISRYDPTANG